MQPKAARKTETPKTPFALALLAALVGASAALPARADNLPDARKPLLRPGKPQGAGPNAQAARNAASAARCARYGEGFVPVVGSDSCVKIGGRLRIDLGAAGAAPVYAGSRDGFNPAAHLRVGR